MRTFLLLLLLLMLMPLRLGSRRIVRLRRSDRVKQTLLLSMLLLLNSLFSMLVLTS